MVFESAIDKEQDLQCNYAPGSSSFIRGIITHMEQPTAVGDSRCEQTTENCRDFSAIAMQLLHDLGAIFL
jgi:hypothetical protein